MGTNPLLPRITDEGREFSNHAEVMGAIDRHIKALAHEINPKASEPSRPKVGVSMDDAAREIEHFISLAENGSKRGAARGEQLANGIAIALLDIGEDFMELDPAAISGICCLITLVAGPLRPTPTKLQRTNSSGGPRNEDDYTPKVSSESRNL
jgi:hypothetical protein